MSFDSNIKLVSTIRPHNTWTWQDWKNLLYPSGRTEAMLAFSHENFPSLLVLRTEQRQRDTVHHQW